MDVTIADEGYRGLSVASSGNTLSKLTKIISFGIVFLAFFTSVALMAFQKEGGNSMSVEKILFNVEKAQGYLEFSKIKEWDIVVSENAIPSEKYAAEEFQRLF